MNKKLLIGVIVLIVAVAALLFFNMNKHLLLMRFSQITWCNTTPGNLQKSSENLLKLCLYSEPKSKDFKRDKQ